MKFIYRDSHKDSSNLNILKVVLVFSGFVREYLGKTRFFIKLDCIFPLL